MIAPCVRLHFPLFLFLCPSFSMKKMRGESEREMGCVLRKGFPVCLRDGDDDEERDGADGRGECSNREKGEERFCGAQQVVNFA